jgi:hypothetical protein
MHVHRCMRVRCIRVRAWAAERARQTASLWVWMDRPCGCGWSLRRHMRGICKVWRVRCRACATDGVFVGVDGQAVWVWMVIKEAYARHMQSMARALQSVRDRVYRCIRVYTCMHVHVYRCMRVRCRACATDGVVLVYACFACVCMRAWRVHACMVCACFACVWRCVEIGEGA